MSKGWGFGLWAESNLMGFGIGKGKEIKCLRGRFISVTGLGNIGGIVGVERGGCQKDSNSRTIAQLKSNP